MLTRKQKMLLHVAAKEAGVDEPARRVIQRNVGGFYSAADKTATHEGFAAVMAHYEHLAGKQLARFSAGYWRDADQANRRKAEGGPAPTDRLKWRIAREAEAMGMTNDDVDRFLSSDKMSSGLFLTVADADAYWLNRLLQSLIEMRKRAGIDCQKTLFAGEERMAV